MLNKIALIAELLSAAEELDRMGKFGEADKLASTMEVLAEEVNRSLFDTRAPHGRIRNQTERSNEMSTEVANPMSVEVPVKTPVTAPVTAPVKQPPAPKRKLSMRDVISTYNSIMTQKGYGEYMHGKELMLGTSWKELDGLVKRHFGLKAGRDYRNWKQMIRAIRGRSSKIPTAAEKMKSEQMKVTFQNQKERSQSAPVPNVPQAGHHIPA